MSDSNLASLNYAKETTFGTAPTAGYKPLRITGESIISEKESVTSDEIRDDRQVPDLAKVHNQASGSAEFEFSVLQMKDLFQFALQNTYTVVDLTASLTIDSTADTITGAASTFDAVPVGAMIQVSGADAGNNGLHRVIAKAGDGSALTVIDGSFGTDETVSMTVKANTISNGTDRQSVSLEKRVVNSDGNDFYQLFKGMVADTMDITIESRAIVTGSVSFLGLSSTKSDDSVDGDGYDAALVGDVLNGTNNLGNLRTNGQTATERFKTLSLSIANNLRGKDALGVEGNFDVGMGRSLITGSLNAYFLDNTFLTAVDDHSDFAVDLTLTDSAGRTLSIYLPRIKFQNGGNPIEGIDSDVMVDTEIQSILDSTTGKQIIVDVFDV